MVLVLLLIYLGLFLFLFDSLNQSEGGWRLAVPRTAYVIPGRVGLGRAWRRRVRFRCFRCFRFRFRCFRFRPGGSRVGRRHPPRPGRDPPHGDPPTVDFYQKRLP